MERIHDRVEALSEGFLRTVCNRGQVHAHEELRAGRVAVVELRRIEAECHEVVVAERIRVGALELVGLGGKEKRRPHELSADLEKLLSESGISNSDTIILFGDNTIVGVVARMRNANLAAVKMQRCAQGAAISFGVAVG